MSGDAVNIHCCAGAGKSTILLCLCLWILKLHSEGTRVCIHYTAPTVELVGEFVTQLEQAWGSNTGIVSLGYDGIEHKDRLYDYIKRVLPTANHAQSIARRLQEVKGCLFYQHDLKLC